MQIYVFDVLFNAEFESDVENSIIEKISNVRGWGFFLATLGLILTLTFEIILNSSQFFQILSSRSKPSHYE